MIPAAFDYQEPADTERGWDDEVTRVDECVHGEHPIECSLCTSAGFIAAVSGEGDDMQDPDKSHQTGREEYTSKMEEEECETQAYAAALNAFGVVNERRLGSLLNALQIELRKRAETHEKLAKDARAALGTIAQPIKQRATRKDAGLKREEYKAQKGAA